jgi:hypothetical protein
MSVAICTRCRTVQPIEARCRVCAAKLSGGLPTEARPQIETSWQLSDDPQSTNRISAIGLCCAVAVAVAIVVTGAKGRSPWLVAAALASLLLFVGPLLVGVPKRRRKTRMTVELSSSSDGELEIGETYAAKAVADVIVGEELRSAQGLLVRRRVERSEPIELVVNDDIFRLEGTLLALSPLDDMPIGEAAARRRFGLPPQLRLPRKLKVVRTGLQAGVACCVAGRTGVQAEAAGGYRDARFTRTLCGEPGQPVVLC